jgi:FdhD protein
MAERIAVGQTDPAHVAVAMQVATIAGTHARDDLVTIEEPLEIRLGFGPAAARWEQSVSVTMRTPGHDGELALGFLAGEGIISGRADVVGVEHCGPPSPDKGLRNVIRVELASHVDVDVERFLRHFYTTSSCGVCGKASLDAVRVQVTAPRGRAFTIARSRLCALPAALAAVQTEFARTGGLHAAAAFDHEGAIVRVREDVGRHNALDKLIGSTLSGASGASGAPGAVGAPGATLVPYGLMLSGRASFELLQKAAIAGVELVASVGPPSSLAIELAREHDITLAGFLKADRVNLYCVPERVVLDD